ncbi:MAG TPA: hypothetical protein VL574_07000 [Stellaceae bacterium]|nr:hypothetical protein [Stellaceae bacterium]
MARYLGARLSACTLTLALLGGCGFTPVYGDHQQAAVAGNLSQVKVAQIPNRLGVVLTNRLRDAFDPTSNGPTPQYQLVVKLTNSNSSFATRPDGTAAWTDVLIKADWHLENIADGKPITEGSAAATTGYSMSNDGYANVTSQQADEMRDIDQLALQIQDQVALYFKTGTSAAIAPGAEPPPAPMAAVVTP